MKMLTIFLCMVIISIGSVNSLGLTRLCITSDDDTQFPSQCVLCWRLKLQSIYQACTGLVAPLNVPYNQAYCIANRCLRQVPMVGKRKREAEFLYHSYMHAIP